MKKIILFLFISFAFKVNTSSAQCTIFNAGFETWMIEDIETISGDTVPYELAAGWISFADFFGIAFGGSAYSPVITKSTDKHLGLYAAKMSAADSADADLLTVGACMERPKKLTGYYKYDGKAGDTLMCLVGMTQGNPDDFLSSGDPNDAIGYGETFLTANNAYAKFTVNIAYSSAQIPDSFLIAFGLLNGSAAGTITAYIDDLQFEELSSVSEISNVTSFTTFPNPSGEGIFYMNIENLKSDFVQISGFNMAGQQIFKNNTATAGKNHHQEKIDLSTYSKGLYIVQVTTESGIYQEKLRVQ